MSDTLISVLAAGGAYLLGAIPFGLLVAWLLCGADLRESGSRNVGATNAARVLSGGRPLGWLIIFLLVLGLDACKGAAPVLFLKEVAAPSTPTAAVTAGIGAIVGHLFPVWLKFHGGKGVAVAAGVFLVLDPTSTAVAGGAWLGAVLLTRFVSVASLCATAVFPAVRILRDPGWAFGPGTLATIVGLGVCAIILWRHRANIARLRRGTEPRIGTVP
ncbi:MAG: glycerol-3-phosphate 1-O-acyltransferase PlsY [Planctomycetales bacterium]|nr:glycerol-3-phosphate 1-O-acyltransferase PlsY [Planctomycetales bacterium]